MKNLSKNKTAAAKGNLAKKNELHSGKVQKKKIADEDDEEDFEDHYEEVDDDDKDSGDLDGPVAVDPEEIELTEELFDDDDEE